MNQAVDGPDLPSDGRTSASSWPATSPQPDVTVVVPVYNAGERIVGLVDSVEHQTLAPGRVEMILVDDGSAQETAELLDRLAAEREWVHLERIPNSGWPGRPRNVGTRAARGRYIFYADQDDELVATALEDMCTMADRNTSDVVYGKVVGVGRNTPYWSLAHRDIPQAEVTRDPLADSRTVHKLYRREFIERNAISFPEGRVRLEDHHFMDQVFACSPRISVLASRPCYRWINHDDAHASGQYLPPAKYWDFFATATEMVEVKGGDRQTVDVVRAAAAAQAFSRARIRRILSFDPEKQDKHFRALTAWVDRAVPERVDPLLPVLKRLRIQALRTDDRRTFALVHAFAQKRTLDVQVTRMRCNPVTGLELALQITLGFRRPHRLTRQGAVTRLRIGTEAGPNLEIEVDPADAPTAEVTVRHRESDVEWPIASSEVRGTRIERGSWILDLTARIHPRHAAFGTALDTGTWDVLVRTRCLGESSIVHLMIEGDNRRRPKGLASLLPPALVVRGQSNGLALRVYRVAPSRRRRTPGPSGPGVRTAPEAPPADAGRPS